MKELINWRSKYNNCLDCAEYQEPIPTKMCNVCVCYQCIEDRSQCLKYRYCKKENVEF